MHNDQACEHAQVNQLLPSSLLVGYDDDSIVKSIHRLLFQGTQNGFPGPTWWLTPSVNPLPVDLIPPPAPGMHMMYYIRLGKTPIHPTLRKKLYSEIL